MSGYHQALRDFTLWYSWDCLRAVVTTTPFAYLKALTVVRVYFRAVISTSAIWLAVAPAAFIGVDVPSLLQAFHDSYHPAPLLLSLLGVIL